MTDFKAKMHPIRFRLGLRPRPRWGSLQRSPRPPSWIWGPTSKEREREGKEGRGGEGKGGEGREGVEREGEGRKRKRGKGRGGKGHEPPPTLFGVRLRLWCPPYLQILATPLLILSSKSQKIGNFWYRPKFGPKGKC